MLARIHQSRMSPGAKLQAFWGKGKGENSWRHREYRLFHQRLCKKGKHQLQRKTRNGRLICQWTVIRINKESRQKASAGRLFPFFYFLPSRRWSFDTVDAFFLYAV